MEKAIDKVIINLIKEENKIINKRKNLNSYDIKIKNKIYDKIPEKLIKTLELAFEKAFHGIFIHGSKIIEKTCDLNDSKLDFIYNDTVLSEENNIDDIKNFDIKTKKNNTINNLATTTLGLGLGFFGMGLPDIPLLVATIMRGIYQISTNYGISYKTESEQIYILRLIRVALLNNDEKVLENKKLNEYESLLYTDESFSENSLADEIKITSKVMANELLIEKFVQGFPIVGACGGIVNFSIYKKISNLADIKYKKRYLKNKMLNEL